MAVRWDIRRNGHAWTGEQFGPRWELTPEKFEADEGWMLWHENDRINLLALLLEQVGADAAVRLGPMEVWEAAIEASRGKPRAVISRRPFGWEDGYEGEYPSHSPT